MKVDFFDGLVLTDSFCVQTIERVTEMMKTLFEANGLPSRPQELTRLAAVAGHSSVATNERYDGRGDEAKKRAAKALQLPHQRMGTLSQLG